MTFDEAMLEVRKELGRAINKFPTWPTDPLHAFSVVTEEHGETCQAILQTIYEPERSDRHVVRIEATQLAAMSIRFLMSLDRYEYRQQHRHEQD